MPPHMSNSCAHLRRESGGALPPDEAVRRHEVVVGMTPGEVLQSWGPTRCVFEDSFEGQPATVWAFGRDSGTEELKSITSADDAVLLLYFVAGRVAGWATRT